MLLILAAGGGAAVYFLVLKPKQGKKVPADLDDFDLEDEEEYLTEDEKRRKRMSKLIIAEKPSVAKSIASALGASSSRWLL